MEKRLKNLENYLDKLLTVRIKNLFKNLINISVNTLAYLKKFGVAITKVVFPNISIFFDKIKNLFFIEATHKCVPRLPKLKKLSDEKITFEEVEKVLRKNFYIYLEQSDPKGFHRE